MTKKIFALLVALAFAGSAFAQQAARTAYFMESYSYRYKLNPSFIPEKGHLAIGLGNLSVTAESNADTKAIIQYDASTDTYDVLNENCLKYLPDNLKLNLGEELSLFSLGFNTGKMFHSFDVDVKTNAALNAPKSALDLLLVTEDEYDNHYSFPYFGLMANSRLSISYGLACQLTDRFSVGGRAKLFLGLAGANIRLNETTGDVTDDFINIKTSGNIDVWLPKGAPVNLRNGNLSMGDFEPEGLSDVFPSGFGLGVDLGATYEVFDGLTVSAAVLDLGFMRWGNVLRAKLSDFSVDRHADEVEDDLPIPFEASLLNGGMGKLAATVNAGVEYAMPFYDGLSLGVMGTRHLANKSSWSDVRGIVNIRAPKVIELAGSAGLSSFGTTFGAAMHLHFGPVSIFTAVDSLAPVFSLDENFLPEGKLNTNVAFGLNIIFGQRRDVL